MYQKEKYEKENKNLRREKSDILILIMKYDGVLTDFNVN